MRTLIKTAAGIVMSAGAVFGMNLVEDGLPHFSISAGTTIPEKIIVHDFTRIIKAITGVKQPSDAGGVRIIIGTPETNPLIAEAAKKFDFNLDAGGRDQFAVKADPAGSALYCAGNNPRSAMFAVYELLGQLGCRWYWPGRDGEFLPENCGKLTVPDDLDIRSKAAFSNRQLSTHPNGTKSTFFARNMLNPYGDPHKFGFTESWGGHSFNWIFPEDCETIEEYFTKYPEQFALNDGVRTEAQHCYTNEDTVRTFTEWICNFWETHPKVEILNLSARDSPVFCRCPECSKYDSSTLYFQFINRIVEGASKKYPGKKYATIAYSFYLKPPKVKLHDSVTLSYCMYNRCYMHRFSDDSCKINHRAIEAMKAWKEVLGKSPAVYGYHFDVFSGKPHYAALGPVLADEIRWARDFGADYWHTEYYSKMPDKDENRANSSIYVHRLPVYVAARMMWNPDRNYEDIVADFCTHVYGKAAPYLIEYFRLFDAAWQGKAHASYYNNKPAAFADSIVSPSLIEKLDPLFEKALAAVADNERASAEVALEKEIWERWRDLRLTRDNWARLAALPDTDRLDILSRTAAGGLLFDAFSPEHSAMLARTCVISNEGEMAYAAFSKDEEKRKSDGLLFGNHPKFPNSTNRWINYEVSITFRFPEGNTKHGMEVLLRKGGERFGEDKFDHIYLHVDRRRIGAAVNVRHGEPETHQASAAFSEELDDGWHSLSIRLTDTKMTAKIDGRESLACNIPLGAGYFNIRSYSPLDIARLEVREIPSPSLAEMWTVKVPFSSLAPNMDGTGKDKAWDAGKTAHTFENRGIYRPKSQATLLRTDKALYIRFTGYGDMQKAKATCLEQDGDVYNDDGVELYLDPNNTRTDYYWLVINTANTRCDAEASIGMNIRRGWNGKWRSATSMHDDHWVIEIELPYSTFGRPAEGIPWLLGLNRCGKWIRQSWTDASYHSPNSFRTLYME